MASREEPMLRRYRERHGGTLVLEFPAVKRSREAERRQIDGLLFPDVPYLDTSTGRATIVDWRSSSDEDRAAIQDLVRSAPMIVLQAKSSRLGMMLLGQALFSPQLMRRHGATVIRSVALCGQSIEPLKEIAESIHGLEVVEDPVAAAGPERKSLLKREPDRIRKLALQLGGALVEHFPILAGPGNKLEDTVDAAIFPALEPASLPMASATLHDRDVILVNSTDRRLGMYVMGRAVFSMELAKRAGARSVRSIALCRANDAVLGRFLSPFDGVEVMPRTF